MFAWGVVAVMLEYPLIAFAIWNVFQVGAAKRLGIEFEVQKAKEKERTQLDSL
jgi:hypothetical protein